MNRDISFLDCSHAYRARRRFRDAEGGQRLGCSDEVETNSSPALGGGRFVVVAAVVCLFDHIGTPMALLM